MNKIKFITHNDNPFVLKNAVVYIQSVGFNQTVCGYFAYIEGRFVFNNLIVTDEFNKSVEMEVIKILMEEVNEYGKLSSKN